MNDPEDLQKLLRLKRYEQPDESYYDQFLSDFQSRQRSEMLNLSSRELLMERVSTFMWGNGNAKWAVAAGGASVLAATALLATKPGTFTRKSDDPASVDAMPPMVESSNLPSPVFHIDVDNGGAGKAGAPQLNPHDLQNGVLPASANGFLQEL